MAVTTQVVGLREANRALRALPDLARGEVQQVMDVTAFQVSASASRGAPDRSAKPKHGIHLKDAIGWSRRRFGAVVTVDNRAFHWKFWEYGAIRRIPIPRRMFRNAADAVAPDHQRRLEDALGRANTKMAALAPSPRTTGGSLT